MNVFLWFLLVVSLFLLNMIKVKNMIPWKPMQEIPMIPMGTAQSIVFSTTPFDQALEKLLDLCPEAESIGMFQTRLYFGHSIWITDYDLIKELVSKPNVFVKTNRYKYVQFMFGDGIFNSNGEVWNHHRRVLQSSFSQTKFTKLIAAGFRQLNGKLDVLLIGHETAKIPIQDLLGRVVFQTMGKFAYNYDYQALEDTPSPYFLNYGRLITLMTTKSYLFHLFNLHPESFPLSFLTKFYPDTIKLFTHHRDFYEATKMLYDHMRDVLDKRRNELNAMSEDEVEEQTDVLAKILKKENRSFKYTDKDIAEDLFSLFVAGHDTTASSISFALYHLAKNPDWQEKARNEARAFMETFDPSEELSPKDLEKRLPCLHLIIMETWRVTPPVAGLFGRHTLEDDVYIGGHLIPKGSGIVGLIYTAHRSKTVWGPDAHQFHPERFCFERNPELGADPKIERMLLTFSYGSRSCLGTAFATIQIYLGLAHFISQYAVRIPEGSAHAERCQVRPFIMAISPVNFELDVRKA